MKIIAHIHNDFPTKFGLPRQSGLAPALLSEIVFEPEYRKEEALRGLDGFSHLWLLWSFSEAEGREWSPTVRPPRLGGNKRMGVFATRSPFRPNPIGLSCVKLLEIRRTANNGCTLIVSGADIMNGTPIFDIKPYLPLADCHADAVGGFSEAVSEYSLDVSFPDKLRAHFTAEQVSTLLEILSQDPRPAYHDDPERVYGFEFAGCDVRFTVDGNKLSVCEIADIKPH